LGAEKKRSAPNKLSITFIEKNKSVSKWEIFSNFLPQLWFNFFLMLIL
jgi:hypothetical protein